MEKQEKEVLNKEIADKRKDVSGLKQQLNDINIEKEKFYQEKETHSKNIKQLLSNLKSLKRERLRK